MSSKRLSIVVPYRNRKEHMGLFVPYMEKFLTEAGIEFQITLAEQEDGKPFNRAKLLNVGFDIDKDSADYFCFHDVDMIPIEADYSWVNEPTHMATECSQFGYALPYIGYFGGVTLFNKKDFIDVNGYSNDYWGWGAEDDDMHARCVVKSKIPANAPPNSNIPRRRGRYESLAHDRVINREEYISNIEKLRNLNKENANSEGLTTLQYTLIRTTNITDKTKICTVSI